MIASKDDPTTQEVDGFIEGRTMTFKLWKASTTTEYTNVTATYTPGYSGIFQGLGTTIVGLSAVGVTQTVTVGSPNGGENWQIGTAQNITWTSSNITNVKIEYTTNNGTNWITIISSVPATPATYLWTIPNTPSTQCKVRISDASDGSPSDESNNTFTISPPSQTITVNSPNGGEDWQVGTSQNITWTSSNITNVKIEYTTNNGTNWSTIISSVPSTPASYSWTIPNTPSTQCKVRISDAADETPSDESNNTFTISSPTQTITVNSPNGGENWQVGTTQNITWTSSNITNVKIEYTTNNGTSWSTIISSVPATPASYSWTIPNTPSTQCKVKISDASDEIPSDESNSVFTISGSINHFQPVWTSPYQPMNIYVTSSTIDGNNMVSGDEVGIFDGSVCVGAKALTGPIIPGSPLSMIASKDDPTTPEVDGFIEGHTMTFKLWKASTTTEYTNVTATYTPGYSGIFQGLGTTIVGLSTSTTQTVNIVSPNGGENWQVGTTQNITWTSSNITNIKIEYTTNNGTSWSTIISSVPATPAWYSWTIPNTPSTQCKVKISDASDGTPADMSDNTFTISPPTQTITLVSPNGGENWQVGTSQNITWTSSNITNVKIEYTTNNGTSWSTIISSVSATPATYSWTIPNTPSTQCKVRISDASDGTPSDESNGVFTISGSMNHFQPVWTSPYQPMNVYVTSATIDGNNMVAGDEVGIFDGSVCVGAKTLTGPIIPGSPLSMIASKDDPTTQEVDGFIEGRTMTFKLWKSSTTTEYTNITATYATGYSGIFQGLGTTVVGLSVVIQTVTVVTPNGGEDWQVGTSQNITWASSNITNVKIEYTTNNGTSWNLIGYTPALTTNKVRLDGYSPKDPSGTIEGELGIYAWTIPNTPSTQCKVRVSDSTNTVVNDISDNTFTITDGTIGENWTVQTSGTTSALYSVSTVDANVAWAGGLGGVMIRTTNGGTNWTVVTSPRAVDVYNVKAIDANKCLVTTSGTADTKIHLTTNGGTSWTDVYTQAGGFINVLEMFDANNGYAQGDPVGGNWTLLKTTNGGASWSSAVTLAQTGTEAGWNNSWSWVGTTGWFGTNNLRVYKTTDGGATWTNYATTVLNSYSVAFGSAAKGFTGSAAGTANISTNGGVNWVANTTPATGNILGATTVGADEYWFTSGNNVYYSSNHGTNWGTGYAGTAALYDVNIKGLGGANAVGYAVGTSGGVVKYFRGVIAPSITVTAPNGGEEWYRDSTYSILWTTENFTGNVNILLSIDGGLNYSYIIASNVSNSGSYTWKVPLSLPSAGSTLSCKVKIESYTSSTLFDVSNGSFIIRPPVGVEDELSPTSFALTQNYPNPFNPSTTIEYQVPQRSFVKIAIFNSLGQLIKTLIEEESAIGRYSIIWDGTNVACNSVPSGTYFYQIRAGNFFDTKKMVLLR